VTSAHHAGQRRWLVLAVVVAVIAGLAIAARSPGKSLPGGPPPAPAALVGAPDTESSAWYCTGQTTVAGQLASGSLVLTNTGLHTVAGTIDAVTDTGAKVQLGVSVPARDQLVATLPAPTSGTWLSSVVMLAGGGVAVSQTLHGASGWAEAPCQSSTAQQWYFPSGVTTGSDSLFIALFNPTSTPDVVDLSFTTPKGVLHPINFQGLVLAPDQTQVESVAPFVQDQSSVATTVTTRTGRVVANELELLSTDGSGLAIVPGSARPQQQWVIPQSVETAGAPAGSSTIDIFNPGSTTQNVTVRARLGSGPLTPFQARVAPQSTWELSTADQTRLPKGDPYSVVVDATGGSGIVVGRTIGVPAASVMPQAGMANAVDALTAHTASREWVVPAAGSTDEPAVPGVTPSRLELTNLSGGRESYVVSVLTPAGLRTVSAGQIERAATFAVDTAALVRAGLRPLLVRTSAAAAVSEDVGPSGTYGAIVMPGIALARAATS
jgi:hypothetical protein